MCHYIKRQHKTRVTNEFRVFTPAFSAGKLLQSFPSNILYHISNITFRSERYIGVLSIIIIQKRSVFILNINLKPTHKAYIDCLNYNNILKTNKIINKVNEEVFQFIFLTIENNLPHSYYLYYGVVFKILSKNHPKCLYDYLHTHFIQCLEFQWADNLISFYSFTIDFIV